MPTVKTTINIDEETWDRFKKTVSSSGGSLRNLSGAVEEAIRSFNTGEILRDFMEAREIDGEFPSLKEVEGSRPMADTSAGEAVRAIRDERAERLPGY